jgi:hypothetical protein
MRGRVLYALDRERTYHFVTVVLVALAGVVVWLTTESDPAQMASELGSVGMSRLLQAGWLSLGLGPIIAWGWWCRRYVRRISWLVEEGQVELERFGYFGRRIWRLSPADFVSHTSHAETRTSRVHAPYDLLRLRGLPPLILDRQGTIHDEHALAAVLSGHMPD